MPDIAMCTNHNCPQAKLCYRHEAEPDPYWQSYSFFELDEYGGCIDFISTTTETGYPITSFKSKKQGSPNILKKLWEGS